MSTGCTPQDAGLTEEVQHLLDFMKEEFQQLGQNLAQQLSQEFKDFKLQASRQASKNELEIVAIPSAKGRSRGSSSMSTMQSLSPRPGASTARPMKATASNLAAPPRIADLMKKDDWSSAKPMRGNKHEQTIRRFMSPVAPSTDFGPAISYNEPVTRRQRTSGASNQISRESTLASRVSSPDCYTRTSTLSANSLEEPDGSQALGSSRTSRDYGGSSRTSRDYGEEVSMLAGSEVSMGSMMTETGRWKPTESYESHAFGIKTALPSGSVAQLNTPWSPSSLGDADGNEDLGRLELDKSARQVMDANARRSQEIINTEEARTEAVLKWQELESARKRQGKQKASGSTVASKALGDLTRGRSSQRQSAFVAEAHWNPFRRRLLSCVLTDYFEYVSLAMIFLNAAAVGIQTDYQARNTVEDEPPLARGADVFFCVFFTLEIFIKLYVWQTRFFHMWGWAWNIFDLTLVLLQLFEEVAQLLLVKDNGTDTVLLRTIRILRAIRVVRLLRVMSVAKNLQLLVSCILHSFSSFFWATSLLGLMIYIVSIYVTQAVFARVLEDNLSSAAEEELSKFWGSVPVSMLTLVQALLGGVDWHEIVSPIFEHISIWMGLVLVFIIVFTLLAVLNVITGNFVQSSLEGAAEIKDVHRLNQARKMFVALDRDSSGTISLDELCQHLLDPVVQEFFASVDIDPSEARSLFELIDLDNSGIIDFEEFLTGCMRLHGPSKATDLLLVNRDLRNAFSQQREALMALEQHICDIKEAIYRQEDDDDPASHVNLDRDSQCVIKGPLRSSTDGLREAARRGFEGLERQKTMFDSNVEEIEPKYSSEVSLASKNAPVETEAAVSNPARYSEASQSSTASQSFMRPKPSNSKTLIMNQSSPAIPGFWRAVGAEDEEFTESPSRPASPAPHERPAPPSPPSRGRALPPAATLPRQLDLSD